MDNKVILIGLSNKFSHRTNRILYLSIGVLFMFNGIFNLISNSFKPIGLIVGILTIGAAITYFCLGYLIFSKQSKYAPRIDIKENGILLKSDVFKSSNFLSWDQIKKIEFDQYRTKFKLDKGEYVFDYSSNADTSILIKSTIREEADMREIIVVGG